VAMISAVYGLAVSIGANRVVGGVRIPHVCGDPDLPPEWDFKLGLQITRTALDSLTVKVEEPTFFDRAKEKSHAS
jgi:betaine reductase